MRLVVALACLYAGVAISDPHPGTEVSQQAAARQPFGFFGRRKNRYDSDDDDSGSGSDDEGPRKPWSHPSPKGMSAPRPKWGGNVGGWPRGFGLLGKLPQGKGGIGAKGKSPWGRFGRKDDDDDRKSGKSGRGKGRGKGRDDASDYDSDSDRKSRKPGRGNNDDDKSGSDDDEKPEAGPKMGPGKTPGRGKASDEMTRPGKGLAPKGPPGLAPKGPPGLVPKGPPPPTQIGSDIPPAQQSPPRAPPSTPKGPPTPKAPPQAAKAPPPAKSPKAQGGRTSPMSGGVSPPERWERVSGLDGAGIWKQAPTPGGSCPKGIYHPKRYTTFQYLLNGRIDVRAPLLPGIETYILDMFETTEQDIAELHRQGRKVICYFNAGGAQEGNPDNGEFSDRDKGSGIAKDDAGSGYWPGEKWLDTSSPAVRKVMFKRIQLGLKKGCLGFEFDNVDAHENNNGLKKRPTLAQSAEYVRALCGEAHRNCMSCNLKNSPEMIPLVNSTVQYYVNEQCVVYNHCNAYHQVGKSKPIFHIEYTTGRLTGQGSSIVPGSNQEPKPGEDDDGSGDDEPKKGNRGGSGGRGGGQRSGGSKFGGGMFGGGMFGGSKFGGSKFGGGQFGAAKSGGAQSGAAKFGRSQSGGMFGNFLSKFTSGRGRGLSKRAEQVGVVDRLDQGNRGTHKEGEAWYCPAINGMSSILGHEGLEGEIQTCGGVVHRSRVRA